MGVKGSRSDCLGVDTHTYKYLQTSHRLSTFYNSSVREGRSLWLWSQESLTAIAMHSIQSKSGSCSNTGSHARPPRLCLCKDGKQNYLLHPRDKGAGEGILNDNFLVIAQLRTFNDRNIFFTSL